MKIKDIIRKDVKISLKRLSWIFIRNCINIKIFKVACVKQFLLTTFTLNVTRLLEMDSWLLFQTHTVFVNKLYYIMLYQIG